MENPGVLNKCLCGEAPPGGPTPYPFICHFSRKRYPFRTKQPVVAFRRSPNPRDILVREKLANIDNTSKPPASTFRCHSRDIAASPVHTLTMGKHHTLSTTQEEQDKMNITLLVTQQT